MTLPGRPISPTVALMKIRNQKVDRRYLTGIDVEEVKKLIFAAETNCIGSINKFPSNKRFYQFASIEKWCKENDVPIVYDSYTVSYTHLTLPTIYSV